MNNAKIISSLWYKGNSTLHGGRAVLRKAKEMCAQNNVSLQIPKGEKEAMKEILCGNKILAFFRLSKPYFWQNPFTRAVWQEAREWELALVKRLQFLVFKKRKKVKGGHTNDLKTLRIYTCLLRSIINS